MSTDMTDSQLKEVIENYSEQIDLVNNVEHKIHELQSKKKTKKEEDELVSLMKQLPNDIEDLKLWKKDAEKAQKILEERQSKGKQSAQINRDKKLYSSLIHRWLSKGLSEKELKTAVGLINACTTKEKMKSIYNQYRNIALSRAPSTQALTAEEVEQRENPLEDIVPSVQAFARAKLSQRVVQSKYPSVLEKPPKHVSRPHSARASQPQPLPEDSTGAQTQTSQTQTLVPLNAFKFIEKGNKRFLEPMTPEKAEELSIKKKTITSETILNPNRFQRKPHIWYSRAR